MEIFGADFEDFFEICAYVGEFALEEYNDLSVHERDTSCAPNIGSHSCCAPPPVLPHLVRTEIAEFSITIVVRRFAS